jgi:23S rRNA (cytosine1962-C5)-methyltransferase
MTLPTKRGDWLKSLRAAGKRRDPLARSRQTTAYRWVAGAGDALPGVTIDVYDEYLVVSLSSDEALAKREPILDALAEVHAGGIYLKLRPRKASTLVDTRREDVAPALPARGPAAPDPVIVSEHGVDYAVSLGDGLSTGLFLDQRIARGHVRQISQGARVANLFCYHGAFTVAAIAGGAVSSVSVDSSGAALDKTRQNLERYPADRDTHRLANAEARAWLRRRAKSPTEDHFDLIVLDPPSFSSTKRGTFRIVRDYPALLHGALGCLAPKGRILACCNMHSLPLRRFRKMVRVALEEADRAIVVIDTLPAPEDFLAPPGEEHYQKNLLITLE